MHDDGADHSGVNRAVVRERSSRLERERETAAWRDGRRVPSGSIGGRRMRDGIGVYPRHRTLRRRRSRDE